MFRRQIVITGGSSPWERSAGSVSGTGIVERRTVRFSGTVGKYLHEFPAIARNVQTQLAKGLAGPLDPPTPRQIVAAPLIQDDRTVGVICVSSSAPGPFTDSEVARVETFAAQAVIAIENTRLSREQQEAVQQLTVTTEVLEIVSKTAADAQPALCAIAERASSLCDAEWGPAGWSRAAWMAMRDD